MATCEESATLSNLLLQREPTIDFNELKRKNLVNVPNEFTLFMSDREVEVERAHPPQIVAAISELTLVGEEIKENPEDIIIH
jgi:hypothetical protein